MFDLLHRGHIKPIQPRKVFSYTEIGDAIRYMRGGTHIGKIVISRATAPVTAKMQVISIITLFLLQPDLYRKYIKLT